MGVWPLGPLPPSLPPGSTRQGFKPIKADPLGEALPATVALELRISLFLIWGFVAPLTG